MSFCFLPSAFDRAGFGIVLSLELWLLGCPKGCSVKLGNFSLKELLLLDSSTLSRYNLSTKPPGHDIKTQTAE